MKHSWKKTHKIYWKDEINDDFDQVGLSRPPVPENYKYIRNNPINNFFSWILFFLIAKPILSLVCIFSGIKVVGRKNLKEYKKCGCYIYSNHVSISDAFKIQAYVIRGKRTNIIAYSDSLTLPVVKHIERALGYLPLPLNNDLKNIRSLIDSLDYYISKNQNILIFPEAHIWPYYTKIRNFKSASFTYPARTKSPVIPIVTTFRKVWYSKKPRQTLIVGKPILPKPNLSDMENKNYLYEECLSQMKNISESVKQKEYIEYIKILPDN